MSMDLKQERQRLEEIAEDSWYANGPMATSLRYLVRVLDRHRVGNSCLELGPAEGLMSAALAQRFGDLTLVDGSRLFCDHLRTAFPQAAVVNSLFEAYEPERCFDTVVLGHVLEHVADPVKLLRRAASWLTPGGVIFACVPNARSLHRQAAVLMGLLPHEAALNEMDHHHGHRRVYTPDELSCDFEKAGLKVLDKGGYWLKPLSNGQIHEQWTQSMLDAYMELGERFPEVAAEIYVVAGTA